MASRLTWGAVRRGTGRVLLAVVGVVAAAFVQSATPDAARWALLALAGAGFALALRPHWGAAALLAGFFVLPLTSRGAPAWDVAGIALLSGGVLHVLKKLPFLGWLLATLPLFALGDSHPWLIEVAPFVFVIGAGVSLARMLLPRPSGGAAPAPWLHEGPLVRVAPRLFEYRKGRRVLATLVTIAAIAAVAGVVIWLGGSEVGLALAVVAASVGASMGLALAIGVRHQLRVDAHGIHQRTLFGSRTVPWCEVSDLFSRTYAYRTWQQVAYCVSSPSRVVSFSPEIGDAAELVAIVEAATGMQWDAAVRAPAAEPASVR